MAKLQFKVCSQWKLNCIIVFLLFSFYLNDIVESQRIADETFAKTWMERVDDEYKELINAASLASWAYNTNITKENQQFRSAVSQKRRDYFFDLQKVGNAFNHSGFQDVNLKRWFSYLGKPKDVNQTWITENDELETKMSTIYSTAKVILNSKEASLEPDLAFFMAKNRNYDELLNVWKDWRDNTGRKMRSSYIHFIKNKNKIAKAEGYESNSKRITAVYGTKNFQQDMEKVLDSLRPYYKLLHAYVMKKLKAKYGEKYFRSGHIPAHITGNMWAQDWSHIADLVLPFPDQPALNVTTNMVAQKYTPKQMFELTDEFFRSMGLEGVDPSFYNKSMLQKPEGREVVCHASAWNFFNGKDVRVKQCTDITMSSLITAHHEMGHIQYYLQYRNLSSLFQSGANPGFHEAIGDAIALSVTTPDHMKAINLTQNFNDTEKTNLNFLMQMALDKISFLPYGFLLDKFRWELYDKENFDEMNDMYWQMRCKYQGIYPPVYRTEKDFDAGAKYHIPSDVPYIRYFFSYVFQFQLYKSMCEAANYNSTLNLNNCNFYKSKEAGDVMARGLKLGSSKDWPEVMKIMINETNLNIQPLLQYFKPLFDYLEDEVGADVKKDEWFPKCPDQSFYISYSHKVSISAVWPTIITLVVASYSTVLLH